MERSIRGGIKMWEAQKEIQRIHKDTIIKAVDNSDGVAVMGVRFSVSDLKKLDEFLAMFAYD